MAEDEAGIGQYWSRSHFISISQMLGWTIRSTEALVHVAAWRPC
jgi:hypothetical protein